MEDLHKQALWLALQHIPQFGPGCYQKLLMRFFSPEGILSANISEMPINPELKDHLQQLQDQGEKHPWMQKAYREMEKAYEQGISIINCQSDLYPETLRETHSAPPLLYLKGDPYLLSECQLAVVGARQASLSAKRLAREWSFELAGSGMIITSGMALGIDTAAHQGALQAGKPTIAVLAHGLDQCYPKKNMPLFDEIAESGLLVSEFALGTSPRREFFPRRNRIISGLAQGVLIVEAAMKSGSLITARYALEQNRDVFAVPGSIFNPNAEGTNDLIRQGAYLVSSASDILEAYQLTANVNALPLAHHHGDKLLECIGFEPTHMDDIQAQSGLGIVELTQALVELEISGLIENRGGNFQRVV